MRESIGGAFLFNLVLIFLGIYISVLAFGIVYAKAYNSKNHIITLIEQYEGVNDTEIESYMAKRTSPSLAAGINSNVCCQYYVKTSGGVESDCTLMNIKAINGACIIPHTVSETKGGLSASMYTVVTFMDVNIPGIRLLTKAFPIAGETTVIYERKKTTD